MNYILFYKTVNDYVVRRAPYRDEHLSYATKYLNRGELLMAGTLSEPVDSAVLIFKCKNPSLVEEFASNDPYVVNGLISEWTIRPWNVVLELR
ncbi:MAG: YciI-like protein [Candidatus Kapabacteria bacterium]|nr:YciI-like protein [Candidatus Kapabacteria bacterium]